MFYCIFTVFQERYRNDCNVAVHLLQCKPNNFMAQKLNSVSQPGGLSILISVSIVYSEILLCKSRG